MIFFNPTFVWYTPSADRESTGSSCDVVSGTLDAVPPVFTINERAYRSCVHRIRTNSAMSSMESASETESDQYSSENEDYQIEVEANDCVLELDESATRATSDHSLKPYVDEPLADEEWLANYRKENEEKDQLENELKRRLENSVRVEVW